MKAATVTHMTQEQLDRHSRRMNPKTPRYIAVQWLDHWAVSDTARALFATSIVGTYKTRGEAMNAARIDNERE